MIRSLIREGQHGQNLTTRPSAPEARKSFKLTNLYIACPAAA